MKRTLGIFLAAVLLLTAIPCGAAGADAPTPAVDLYLEENPSTGYVWTVFSTDETVVRAQTVTEMEAEAETGDVICGAPGTLHLQLLAGKPGTAQVTFTYCRPFESVQPLVKLVLPVIVDENQNLLCAEILLAGDSEDAWSCTAQEGTLDAPRRFDAEAGLCCFPIQSLAQGEERLVFARKDGLDGFALDFSARDRAARLLSGNYNFSLLPEDGSVPFAPAFLFTTTDREGNTYTEQIFGAQKLTLLNFWEPWCGPCVREMPDLERLQEEYADSLLILGVYATPGMEDDVQSVLDNAGVTYPILHYTSEFDLLQTGYVPTTVIVNQSGAIVCEPFSGSLPYDVWHRLIEQLMP